MADYRAIAAVCDAIINTLRTNASETFSPEILSTNQQQLRFDVYSVTNFKDHMAAGVSLFLYRILPNAAHGRTSIGKIDEEVKRQMP